MKVSGIFYEIKYDGAVIKYKPKKLVSPILKLFGVYAEKCEFPMSYVLNYKAKQFFGIRLLNIYINSGKYGATTPSPKKIGSFFFLKNRRKLEKHLFTAFDSIIHQNLSGTNIGLSNLKEKALVEYYQGLTHIGLEKLHSGTEPTILPESTLRVSVRNKGENTHANQHTIANSLAIKQA